MSQHLRFFKEISAACPIVAIRIEADYAYATVKCHGDETTETRWTLEQFFKERPSVGRWVVDDSNGRRVMDERDLLQLGEEIPNPYQEE